MYHKNSKKMKTKFTKDVIQELRKLIAIRPTLDRREQKNVRAKMRELGFYGRDCFGIKDMTIEKFDKLINDGRITIIGKEEDKSSDASNKTNTNCMDTKKVEQQKVNNIEKTSDESQCICFDPLIDEESEILILGTMPGKKSLEKGEYYANSSNCFWKIIKDIFNNGEKFTNYQEKCDCLKENHIALWDVLASCQREGSLDQQIKDEIPNNIVELLEKHPNIRKIIFNGQKSQKSLAQELQCDEVLAPSTSSANTKQTYEEKLTFWKEALNIETTK